MAQHRDIVERVRVEDPVTGAWGRSDYVFDRGVCMPGKCLGYEELVVTHTALTPVECGAPGFPNTSSAPARIARCTWPTLSGVTIRLIIMKGLMPMRE